jgi:hypothetical protein
VTRSTGLFAGIRAFLADRMSLAQAEADIVEGLALREEHFLHVVRAGVFDSPHSPYRALFRWAGCEYADLEAAVRRGGVDRTLERLAQNGVYVTADEFKGKKPIVRGNRSLSVTPEDFLPRGVRTAITIASSGTMNRPVRSHVTFEWLAQYVPTTALAFSAHDLFDRAHAIFDAIMPAGGGMNSILIYGRLGIPVARWFARRESPAETWLARQYYYLMTQAVIATCNRNGPGAARPAFTAVSEVRTVMDWLSETLRAGRRCCVAATASNAARIARLAAESGVNLQGTKFIATGEPLTDAKRAAIERVGASVLTRYAYGGATPIGYGCADPIATDDVHVSEHILALIQGPRLISDTGPPIHPVMCTTLHPAAPRLLINVESGDYATMARRRCGCALGRAGLTLHVHRIRSFEKFTSEGMNYYHWDMYDLLENILPSLFGGGPGDYQFVEEEEPGGQTRLILRLAPSIGPVDEGGLVARVHEHLSQASAGNRYMDDVWKSAGTITVRRERPYASPRGKVLPLHITHT